MSSVVKSGGFYRLCGINSTTTDFSSFSINTGFSRVSATTKNGVLLVFKSVYTINLRNPCPSVANKTFSHRFTQINTDSTNLTAHILSGWRHVFNRPEEIKKPPISHRHGYGRCFTTTLSNTDRISSPGLSAISATSTSCATSGSCMIVQSTQLQTILPVELSTYLPPVRLSLHG